MGKYVENNLNKNEVIVQKAKLNGLMLLSAWLKGILLCWLLLIPTIKAIEIGRASCRDRVSAVV